MGGTTNRNERNPKNVFGDGMKKIILIVYNPALDSDILRDRIKSLGPNYTFWGNHWFVETQSSPKEVYKKISADGFETSSLLVIEMSQNQGNYYGRMNTSLWEWLKNRNI